MFTSAGCCAGRFARPPAPHGVRHSSHLTRGDPRCLGSDPRVPRCWPPRPAWGGVRTPHPTPGGAHPRPRARTAYFAPRICHCHVRATPLRELNAAAGLTERHARDRVHHGGPRRTPLNYRRPVCLPRSVPSSARAIPETAAVTRVSPPSLSQGPGRFIIKTNLPQIALAPANAVPKQRAS